MQADKDSGFLFWEDVFDPLPHGADIAEIAVRALGLECDEIYVMPAIEQLIIRFYRKQKWVKSFSMHRSRLPELIRHLELSANMHRSLRDRAQEGTLQIKHQDNDISLFVRVVRTSVGERIHLRLL